MAGPVEVAGQNHTQVSMVVGNPYRLSVDCWCEFSCSATFDNQLRILTGSSRLRAGADHQPRLQNFRLDIFYRHWPSSWSYAAMPDADCSPACYVNLILYQTK